MNEPQFFIFPKNIFTFRIPDGFPRFLTDLLFLINAEEHLEKFMWITKSMRNANFINETLFKKICGFIEDKKYWNQKYFGKIVQWLNFYDFE